MNNRVVANGTPLADRFDNVARVLRRAGYDPTLFGYTDIGIDPLVADGPADPRLDSYDGVLPGFSDRVLAPRGPVAVARVARPRSATTCPRTGSTRCAASRTAPPSTRTRRSSRTAFLEWLGRQPRGLVRAPLLPAAALALRRGGGVRRALRPRRRRAADRAGRDRPPAARRDALAARPSPPRPTRRALRALRAQYFGMVTEVDAQLGRVLDAIRARGEWDDTIVVVRRGPRRAAGRPRARREARLLRGELPHPLHRPRPAPPRGARPRRGAPSPRTSTSCRRSASSLGAPDPRPGRRPAAHLVPRGHDAAVVARRGALGVGLALRLHRPRRRGLAARPAPRAPEPGGRPHRVARLRPVRRRHRGAASTSPRTRRGAPSPTDPAVVLPLAQALAGWRQEHLDRTYTSMLLTPERLGRWPEVVAATVAPSPRSSRSSSSS